MPSPQLCLSLPGAAARGKGWPPWHARGAAHNDTLTKLCQMHALRTVWLARSGGGGGGSGWACKQLDCTAVVREHWHGAGCVALAGQQMCLSRCGSRQQARQATAHSRDAFP